MRLLRLFVANVGSVQPGSLAVELTPEVRTGLSEAGYNEVAKGLRDVRITA